MRIALEEHRQLEHAGDDRRQPSDQPGGRGVSVIIPAYENWPILHRTLAGTLRACRSSGRPFELLVVDNGSGPAFVRSLAQVAADEPAIRRLRSPANGGAPFRPGDARNRGIAAAVHDCLVFIDADCIPASGLVRMYAALTERRRDTVFVGHRVFIDGSGLSPRSIERTHHALESAPVVPSRSNYGKTDDRRLDRLPRLASDPHAYDCLYACNFALHRECLGEQRFNPVFDGAWGYEDVELGFRLQRDGRRFEYVPDAFVYHQESSHQPLAERRAGRVRNFQIAAALIPGFAEYRSRSGRTWALPPELRENGSNVSRSHEVVATGERPSR